MYQFEDFFLDLFFVSLKEYSLIFYVISCVLFIAFTFTIIIIYVI